MLLDAGVGGHAGPCPAYERRVVAGAFLAREGDVGLFDRADLVGAHVALHAVARQFGVDDDAAYGAGTGRNAVALAAPAHLRVEHHVDLIAAAVDHAADGAVEARIQYALRVEVGLVAVAVVNVDVGATVEHEFALLERHIGVDCRRR